MRKRSNTIMVAVVTELFLLVGIVMMPVPEIRAMRDAVVSYTRNPSSENDAKIEHERQAIETFQKRGRMALGGAMIVVFGLTAARMRKLKKAGGPVPRQG